MKPQHIATIGVAGVFALAATSAISMAEYRLMDSGRDALTAFFLPGQNDVSIVDGSRPNYVASDFKRSSAADGPQLVSELNSEIADRFASKAPDVEICATKQPTVEPRLKRVFLRSRSSSRDQESIRVKPDLTVPKTPPEPAELKLASDAPEAPLAETAPTMVFHMDEANTLSIAAQLKDMETTLKSKAILAHMRVFEGQHPGEWKISVEDARNLSKVRVIMEDVTRDLDADTAFASK